MATDTSQAIEGHARRTSDATVSSDDLRHKSYIDDSVDGTWRIDFEEPISIDLPAAEQVELFYRHGYFGEGNLALAHQYGFDSPEQIAGFRLEEFLPRDLPTSIPLLIQLIESNYQAYEWETIEQDRHGNRKIFLNNAAGELEEGKLLCLWGTAKDITRQKQLEEEDRLRSAVFEQIPDACVIMEAKSEKYVYMNPAFTEITGYTAADLPAEKLSFLQGPDTDPDTVAQIRETLAAEATFNGEILNYRKDGTPYWNRIRISPIRDAGGAVTHYAGILSDITAQKQSQEELLAQRSQLAHVARVATMGELTAALAHELNQPLTAILSNAQAALRFLDREAPDVGEVREILQDIVADDKRAGETMHRIRRLVKRDSSRFERLDVNRLVEEVLALTRSDLVMKQLKIITQLTPDLPAVQGDAVQLQQIILNLVMNACQALQDMDAGERRVLITTGYTDNRAIEISVADSGPGIDEQMLEQIFEPFFTTKDDGLGMGLAINRTIIEAHRGRLWADNGTEQGAVFHVTLPVARVEQPA